MRRGRPVRSGRRVAVRGVEAGESDAEGGGRVGQRHRACRVTGELDRVGQHTGASTVPRLCTTSVTVVHGADLRGEPDREVVNRSHLPGVATSGLERWQDRGLTGVVILGEVEQQFGEPLLPHIADRAEDEVVDSVHAYHGPLRSESCR